MRLVLVDPPACELLTAAEARAWLSIDADVPDEVLDAYIAAAAQQLDGNDGRLGRSLITQTWRGSLDAFPCREIVIPLPPLQDVNTLQYFDADGGLQDLDAGDYRIVKGAVNFIVPTPGTSWPGTWDGPDAVLVEFVAGYGDDPGDVPQPIRTAVAMQVRRLLSLSTRDAGLTQRVVTGVSSRSWALDGGAAGGAALDQSIMSLLSTFQVHG